MLSKRLQAIADLIEYGETMADIGTDHGFLPVYLIKTGKCPYTIATDISQNSLKKAENLILSEGILNDCSARVGNGLDPIDNAEVDNVVIAGMGGILMTDILSADLNKSRSFKKFILQPRSKLYYLRKWIRDNDFTIKKERIVKEGERFCEILLVESFKEPNYSDKEGFRISDFFPETLINNPSELTLEYLHHYLIKNEAILNNLKENMSSTNDNDSNALKMKEFEEMVNHLKFLIEKYENKNI